MNPAPAAKSLSQGGNSRELEGSAELNGTMKFLRWPLTNEGKKKSLASRKGEGGCDDLEAKLERVRQVDGRKLVYPEKRKKINSVKSTKRTEKDIVTFLT